MRGRNLKRILFFILLVSFILIQFFPAEKNYGSSYGNNDFTHSISVPDDVKKLLESACFDCHSNHTKSTWYSNIQPIAWWMANHVKEGKEELNFTEFNLYKSQKKAHKLDEISDQIEKGEMAPNYYTLMHWPAKLDDGQKKKIIEWAFSSKKKLK